MLKIRFCEESFVEPILSGEITCPVHLCSGQEAVAVGVCETLSKEDYIFGNHRSHGHFLAKGGKAEDLINEVFCKYAGCSGGRGGSMHLIDPEIGMLGSAPIVAGTISLATGAALASKIRGDKRVAVAFFGDGSSNEGVLFESLNFAALNQLPVIFVCENNFYSTHMPIRDCRPNEEICRIALPFDVPSKRIDGNDVLTVYEVANDAVDACRNGNGPFFIECLTYRLRGHVGPDDNIQGSHTDIRPAEEVSIWKKKDPILRFETYLLESGIISKDNLEEIQLEISKEIVEAYHSVQQCLYPTEEELMNHVFK
jgi:pyruvate dehydrogenase E1 component alpha subunit